MIKDMHALFVTDSPKPNASSRTPIMTHDHYLSTLKITYTAAESMLGQDHPKCIN